ncbi:MAG: quinone-dependent dihydroorotate dehydrogenase [Bifidobacterium mongoliense]|nr:quinone-dependent dihydroorotate dehydrogenase [Bifidobacterium mongoliense]
MSYVANSFWHDAVNKAATDLMTFGYKHVIKPPAVFNHPPDVAHDQMIAFCNATKRVAPLMWLLRETLDYTDPVLETEVMGLPFANPFGLSAGLDKNCDMPVLLDNAGFGFETVGSTTSRPCAGNERPWFHRLPEYDSMLVHVGLANDGSETVTRSVEEAWRRTRTMQMSISIARTNDEQTGDIAEGIDDYRISMERAAGRSSIIEVNVSCPNTKVGEPFTRPRELDQLFDTLDQVDRPQPILVKMPFDLPWERFRELLEVLADHRVDGVTIANLRKNRSGMEIPADWRGGLSGGPTYARGNELIRRTYLEFGDRLVIAGVGGVFTPEQAYAKTRAGSSLGMIISSLMYRGPQQSRVLKRGLAALLRADGFEHVDEAVGIDA